MVKTVLTAVNKTATTGRMVIMKMNYNDYKWTNKLLKEMSRTSMNSAEYWQKKIDNKEFTEEELPRMNALIESNYTKAEIANRIVEKYFTKEDNDMEVEI